MPRLKTNLNDKTRADLAGSLREIIPLVSVTEGGGISLQGMNIFQFETQLLDLAAILEQAMPPMPQSVAAEMIQQVIFKLAKAEAQAQTVDTLFDELSPLLEDEHDRTFSIRQFLNIYPKYATETFAIGGTTFNRLPSNELMPAELSEQAERLNPEAFRSLAQFTAYQYEAATPGYLVRNGVPLDVSALLLPFERMRALLSFSQQGGMITLRHGVVTEPLANFLPSPFTLVRVQDDSETRLYYSPARITYRPQIMRQQTWDKAFDLSARIYGNRQLHQSMVDLLDWVLRLYQQALDATEPAIAFLHFWQVLERLASPIQLRRGIDIKTLLSRLNVITPVNETQRRILRQLGEVRNAYVHGGVFPYGQGDQVNRLLKSYADDILWSLVNTLDVFQSIEDLEQYYYVALDPKKLRLAALKKVLTYQEGRNNRGK